jgi:hypothetical protein
VGQIVNLRRTGSPTVDPSRKPDPSTAGSVFITFWWAADP